MLKALTFHKSAKCYVSAITSHCRLSVRMHISKSFHNQQKLCIWPSHFCHSCYGDGGWICQCSAMATVSPVTPECQWMKNNQYAALSKETDEIHMRDEWSLSWERTNTESMCPSSSFPLPQSLPLSNKWRQISTVHWGMCTELLFWMCATPGWPHC